MYEEVKNKIAMKETSDLVDTFMSLSRSEKYHIGLAALYCYESMQPEISETKKDGLQKFYNIEDENTLKAAIAFKSNGLGTPVLIGKKEIVFSTTL